jgi:hypothetical protein
MASGIVLTGHDYYLVLGPAVCSSVSYAPKLAMYAALEAKKNNNRAIKSRLLTVLLNQGQHDGSWGYPRTCPRRECPQRAACSEPEDVALLLQTYFFKTLGNLKE